MQMFEAVVWVAQLTVCELSEYYKLHLFNFFSIKFY